MATLDDSTPLGRLVHLRESITEFEAIWHEMQEKQSQSLTAKKKLADDTKAFKKLPEEERLFNTPDLLKAYQGEIDALSKRAKYAEGAFETLLRRLDESSEPSALNSQIASLSAAPTKIAASKNAIAAGLEEQVREKDIQIAKLNEATHDLEKELMALTNQAATVRRLEKQVKELETFANDVSIEARKQKDEEWGRHVQELRQEHELQREKHEEVIAQLSRERLLRDDEIEHLRQQRLVEARLADEAVLARSLEVESLTNDLEKMQGELERERFRAENRETQGSAKVLQSLLDGVQKRAAALEQEAAELRQQLADAEAASARRRSAADADKASFEISLATKDAELSQMREELSLRPFATEVADLQQKLRNVETVESSDATGAATDLERRLLQRQRGLEEQLSDARQRGVQLGEEAEDCRRKLQVAKDEIKDLRHLVRRLEADLGETARAHGASSVEPFSTLISASRDGDVKLSPAAVPSIPHIPMPTPQLTAADVGVTGSPCAVSGSPHMPSMLEIVTGQRDRLRERTGDLEHERDRWRTAAEQEKQRGDAMHADNVRLLERVKFMQSFQPKPGCGAGRGRGRGQAVDPDLENRYGAAYEDSLAPTNPLEQFREDEKARRLAGMNAADRSLMVLGSLLYSSKVARNAALVYLSLLHLLVFFVLMKLAHGHNHSLT